MTSVVIVDDHPVVRAGIRAALNATSDIRVAAEGNCGGDALRLAAQVRPDVLILDVNLPDMNGVEVIRQLRAQGLTLAILIVTVYDDRQTVFGLLDSGATGYVLKDDALETIATAVRAVASGETWISPGVAGPVVRRALGQSLGPVDPAPLPLTPRERQVLCLLAQGLDNATIAQHLVVTTRTVQNFVSAIYGKLHVATRTEAALLAIRHGLVQVSPDGKNPDAG